MIFCVLVVKIVLVGMCKLGDLVVVKKVLEMVCGCLCIKCIMWSCWV